MQWSDTVELQLISGLEKSTAVLPHKSQLKQLLILLLILPKVQKVNLGIDVII
jgi:hypothetical protein